MKLTDEQVVRSIRQTRLAVFVMILGLLALVGLVLYLDSGSESFEESARFREQEASDAAQPLDEAVRRAVERPARGQLLYVPAYSHVYHRDGDPVLLTVTLSVRNTSLTQPIVIESVRYFDTDGKEVASYLKQPVSLGPLATRAFLVGRKETAGGSGANFLVRWVAEEAVTSPIVEAIMIDTEQRQGISFARPGTVIEEVTPTDNGTVEKPTALTHPQFCVRA